MLVIGSFFVHGSKSSFVNNFMTSLANGSMSGILQKLPHTKNPGTGSVIGVKFIDSVEFIVVLLFNSIFFMMWWQLWCR